MVRLLIFLVLLPIAVLTQTVPADSLLASEDLRLRQKLFITPIALFQRFSYATPGLHCQFEPSCSHFMALAIARHDVLKGLVIGTDRLIRCNPFAFQYHLDEHTGEFSVDGRLMDPVPDPDDKMSLSRYTAFSVVPGLGRALAGRPGDGFFSFISVATLAAVTLQAYQSENTGGVVVGGSLTILLWLADFYGAGRLKRIQTGVRSR